VMILPRESVFTALVKKRSLKSASGGGVRILRSKDADNVSRAALELL
jgi:hypothetical protein